MATDKERYNQLLLLRDLERKAVREEYWRYVELVHRDKTGKEGWLAAPFSKFLCNKVQEFVQRPTEKPFEILIIHVPVQHGKSLTITETLPSWYLGMYPDKKIIEVSYNSDFAQKFGRKNKEKIDAFGKYLFDIEISSTISRMDEFAIKDHQGQMVSRGILSGITGNPGSLILIDDPIATREDAYSENIRDKVWNEYQNSIKTRCAAGTKIILIMSRWHEDDLAGRIMRYEQNWEYLCLPCECEDEENDQLGRKLGDALFPEIGKNNLWKDIFKQSYINSEGLATWNAMFQGRPTSESGNIIKREWWKYYDTVPEELDYIIISVDCAFKATDKNDFVAIGAFGKVGKDIYIFDVLNKRLGFNDTLTAIRMFKEKYPTCIQILIEDKANGSAVIETLQREIQGVIPIEPKGGKESRVHAITPLIESGCVHLPRFAPWVDSFVDQCSAFPRGKFDDQVDMASQALTRFKNFAEIAKPVVKPKPHFTFEEPKKTLIETFGGKIDKCFFR